MKTFTVSDYPSTPSSPTRTPVVALPNSNLVSATVSWTAPSGQGSPILGYRLYSKVHGTSQPYELIYDGSKRADLLSYTLIGIQQGLYLDVAVTALNLVGESQMSPALLLIPAAAPESP